MYAEFLRLSACEIDEAEDGREALAKALTRRPDVIVTETRLPGMNGFELCNLLRADAATHDIAIVFVTGDAYADDVQHAQTVGADAVLVKPCLPDTLLSEIRRLLQQSRDIRGRARAATAKMHVQLEKSRELIERSLQHRQRRLTLSRAHQRVQTVEPPAAPPALVCPTCDLSLQYRRSHVGGVNARHQEQWDYYECASCGTFQYRHRTRKLRKVT
jgi:CheY-like chemotaxis protein